MSRTAINSGCEVCGFFRCTCHLPRCAKCRVAVREVTREDDPFTGAVTFTVHCHGAREVLTLQRNELIDMQGLRFEGGVAFR